jgi:small ligand-binding sensory domain FIST
MVNSRHAILECLEAALGTDKKCDLVMLHASIGHDYSALADEVRRQIPGVRVVGASCCGIVGSEGVSESMKDVAIMAVRGPELAVAHVDGIYGHNAFEKAAELALELKARQPGITMIHFLASGIDIANDRAIAGIESVFGPEVTIFGATSSDNMRGVISYQIVDDLVLEHGAWAVGFADPSLEVDTQATHGFLAVGEPMVVTRAEGTRIIEKMNWTGRGYYVPRGDWPNVRKRDDLAGAGVYVLLGHEQDEIGNELPVAYIGQTDCIRDRIDQHLLVGIRALELLRAGGIERLHSRKLRSFYEPPFR